MRSFFQQPLVHFFILGALLFGVDRVRRGDPNTVVITSGVRADVTRRFQDEVGRPPTAAELAKSLESWKRDEALFREAQRLGLDRNDRTIRTALIEKLRAQALLEAPRYEPSDAELHQWLGAHREQYEAPRRYTLEWLAFAEPQAQGVEARKQTAEKLAAAAPPQQLGRPLFEARLSEAELRDRWGDAALAEVTAAPEGAWREAAAPNQLLLFRVKQVDGGLPPFDELRPRLLVDCIAARQQQAAGSALDAVVARYRFLEQK